MNVSSLNLDLMLLRLIREEERRLAICLVLSESRNASTEDSHFGVNGVGFVEDVLELDVRRSETVREVLSEEPSRVAIRRFLNGVSSSSLVSSSEEGVVREAVKKGSFLDDLLNRVLDGRSVGVGNTSKVDGWEKMINRSRPPKEVRYRRKGADSENGSGSELTDDRDSVAELLDVFSSRAGKG